MTEGPHINPNVLKKSLFHLFVCFVSFFDWLVDLFGVFSPSQSNSLLTECPLYISLVRNVISFTAWNCRLLTKPKLCHSAIKILFSYQDCLHLLLYLNSLSNSMMCPDRWLFFSFPDWPFGLFFFFLLELSTVPFNMWHLGSFLSWNIINDTHISNTKAVLQNWEDNLQDSSLSKCHQPT